MASAVMAEESRRSDRGGHSTPGPEVAPADRLTCIALRVLATLGLLPLLLVLVAVTGVAIPLCRLVAACEGAVRRGARSHHLSEQATTPDGFGPRR